jgi:undecaprenyl-diphosphatase
VELWQAIVLGIVEGVTEYLPISSTGHLILASTLMDLHTPELKRAVNDFEIVIQGGAILAVVGLYWPRMIQMLRGLLGKDPAGFKLFLNLVLAFIPSAALGLLLKDQIDTYLFHAGPVILSLAIGALYMIAIDRWRKGRFSIARFHASEIEIVDVEPRHALFIGVLQCFALWPGMSRSMMTITGGLLIGLRAKAAAEFSFLLGLPTLGAACVYALYKNLKGPDGMSPAEHADYRNLFETLGPTAVVVGVLVAAVSAAIAVKWLVGFLNKHGLAPFGWYRLVLCGVLLAMNALGWLVVSK